MANKKDFIASGPTKPDIIKSHFDLSYTNNLTANFGKMYPLGTWLMPAGSHFRCSTDFGFDLQPLVFPVQTNMRFHVKFYKAPLRILWKNWRNFVSRGGKGYEMPYINRDTNFYTTGSLSDYMGVPSFQSTEHTHTKTAYFGGVVRIFQNLLVGDNIDYVSNSDIPIEAGFTYLTFAPINYHSFRLVSDNVVISIKTTQLVSLNDTTYLYIATDINNNLQKHILLSVKLTISNCSTNFSSGITTITIPVSTFGDRANFMFDKLYIGLSGNTDSKFFYVPSDYAPYADLAIVNPAHEVEQGENNKLSVPSFQQMLIKRSPYKPLSLSYDYEVVTAENRATHFMSVEGQKPKLPLLAFRWRMYEFIYNYFVRNERVTPFMLPDDNNVMQQVFNQYLTNDGDGADSSTPVDFKYMPYEYDMFTTCVKKPTFGDAPLVGVSFNYDLSGDTPSGEFLLLKEGDVEPESYQVSLDGEGRLTGITAYNGSASNPNLHNLQELINFGISINDLRNVSAYQRYLERMTKAGTKYENIMYEFFGTNPPTGEEFPSYLGGYTEMIRTDKVLSQASTAEMGLGEYRGNAYLRSNGKKRTIKAYCQEDCYIMAVGWFSVTPTYSQKLDKDFVFTSLLDFVNPQFASVSPQPVFDYQIAPLEIDPTDDEALHHVFGYNRPFVEAVSRQDECHGLFRSNMQNFIMQRIFAGAPQLNEQFLYMRPEDLSQIFAVTETEDKIFGQIHFDVNATLPLPHMAVPKII